MAVNDPNTNKPKGEVHGASTLTPVEKKKGFNWLPWLLGLLALLALLFLLPKMCSKPAPAPVNTTTTTTTEQTTTDTNTMTNTAADGAAGTPPVGVKQIVLPGGKTVGLEPNTLNYSLQEYLGSNAPAPRRFTFDRLNFATNSAVLPADAQPTLTALQQIIAAYPKAKVRIEGYADSRGTDPVNMKLGADRASAVAKALVGEGVATNRIETATGGASNPVAPNETAPGRAENRRTDLVVLAK